MAPHRDLKLTELADAAGVTPRTVRYYIAQGLLPSPGRLGPHTRYGPEYLDRLRLIRRLQEEHLPLSEIRRRLPDLETGVSDQPMPPPLAAMLRPMRAADIRPRLRPYHPARTDWERILLSPDIELNVRRPRSAATSRLVEELVRLARDRPAE